MASVLKVMIVEDEAIIAHVTRKQLSKLGYNVIGVFGKGEEAVARVQELKPDVILMDIKLAGKLDGIETADEIQKQLDIPIIYLTACEGSAVLERAKVAENLTRNV